MQKLGLLTIGFFCLLPAFNAVAWTVDYTIGSVTIESSSGLSHDAKPTEVLEPGTTLKTGEGSKAILTDGTSEISIASQTHFKVESAPAPDKKKLGLLHVLQGKIRAKFNRPQGLTEYPYKVQMRTAVAGVRGTEFYVVVSETSETVSTTKGLVHVESLKDSNESWDVPAGKTAIKNEGQPVITKNSARSDISALKKETSRDKSAAKSKTIDAKAAKKTSRH